tara:strand:- start:1751 stop:2488 length:738 start_codon:yes stop_codon:yes gene_type:complete
MYNTSIAKNHISELAQQGRMGDNILVHMNKDEAATLAKAAGLEKLPINPKTGMPEAFALMGALAIGKGLVGAVDSMSQASDASTQAKAQSQMITKQMSGIDEALGGLDEVKVSKEGVVQQEFDQSLGFQAEEMGIAKEDLTQQYQQAVQKTGFASGGAADNNKAQSYKRIVAGEKRGTKSLVGQLGKSMASVEEWYGGEKSRLESEKLRLEGEKNVAEAAAKSAKKAGVMGAIGSGIGAAVSIFG